MVDDIFFKIDERTIIFYGKVPNVSVVVSETHPGQFRPVPATSGRISNFFPFQKKHFFCGIFFSSKSPYLRAVKFNTILGLFLIYNGTLDSAILNKESNHGQNGLYYGDLGQKYTTEKVLFLKWKKIEIRPEVAGTGRNCPGWVSDTTTEKFDTFP